MEQVETSQVFDIEMALEIAPQFECSKQVKAESETPAVEEFDIAPDPNVIVFQMANVSV